MIRNLDGSPYQLTGCFQAYNPLNSTEKSLFNSYDSEIIKIQGTPIFYYEIFIDASTIDPLYHESRSSIFSQTPIVLYAYYDPITSQNYQNMFGIDGPDQVTFELNYNDVLSRLGHPPKIGSRIFSPHKQENWKIKQRGVADWKLWQEIRLTLDCDRFQESLTTGEGRVAQTDLAPSYKVN